MLPSLALSDHYRPLTSGEAGGSCDTRCATLLLPQIAGYAPYLQPRSSPSPAQFHGSDPDSSQTHLVRDRTDDWNFLSTSRCPPPRYPQPGTSGAPRPTNRKMLSDAHCVLLLALLLRTYYNVVMPRTGRPKGLRRVNDPPLLILTSLADGPKHGYALAQDIDEFAGVQLSPGALYGAIARLEERGLIEALPEVERRRPYRLTAAGSAELAEAMRDMRRVVDVGTHRLGLLQGRPA